MFWTYILRCSDDSYYTGHTDDLDARFAAHFSGELKGYTSERLPVELLWSQEFPTRDEAFAAERQIKGWSRAKKEALIAGNWSAIQRLAKRALRDSRASALAPQDERLRDSRASALAPQDERGSDKTAHPEEPKTQSEVSRRTASPPQNERASDKTAHPEGPKTKSEASRRTEDSIQQPVIVLVRPQLGENIGKAARAMLNFGLAEMRLVSPRDGWPNPSAGPAASGADIVLEKAQVFDTTAEAVADCAHVYATTVRKRGVTKPVCTPEEAAREVPAQAGRSAFLFGPERSGLESEDVALARTIVTAPINPEFGSLNLAQAVILVAYELSKYQDLAIPTQEEELPPAPQEELEGLIAHFETLLEPKGYFFPEGRREATRRTLRGVLTKPGWNHLEVRTLRGVLSALGKTRRD